MFAGVYSSRITADTSGLDAEEVDASTQSCEGQQKHEQYECGEESPSAEVICNPYT